MPLLERKDLLKQVDEPLAAALPMLEKRLKVIASGTQEAQDAAMTTYTYTWNGKEVTKAEYESLPSKIYQVQKGEDVEFFTYYSYNELYMLLDSFK